MPEIRVTDNPQTLAHEAASAICSLARAAIRTRGRFTLILSGGSTPRATYEQMRQTGVALDWSCMHFFWGDERCVPPDHPDSNYLLAWESLLAHVPVPAENLHRMSCSPSPQAGADAYDGLVRRFADTWGDPVFDLALLGLGRDGHTASLFPDTAALQERKRWVAANRVPALETWRLTFTFRGLMEAERIFFLVQGSEKADIVRAIIEDGDPSLPAQAVSPRAGEAVWLLDAQAAARLPLTGAG